MAKPVLGRGLSALLGNVAVKPSPTADVASTDSSSSPPAAAPLAERVQRLALGRIRPCPFQPRKEFSKDSLQELADSIREQGIIQPLIVRPKDDHFELIAGERRWRAAQMLELADVPVVIRHAQDHEVLELALIENLQRENLNPLEEALGFAQLMEQFQLRQEDVAARVGKSRVAVTNALRLLKLPADVQNLLRQGNITVGHAKVILGLPTGDEQKLAAECVVKDGLNVRQTEELVSMFQTQNQARQASHPAPHQAAIRDAHITSLESRLRERLGTKVQLHYRQGKGTLHIRFFSDDELERILHTVGVAVD